MYAAQVEKSERVRCFPSKIYFTNPTEQNRVPSTSIAGPYRGIEIRQPILGQAGSVSHQLLVVLLIPSVRSSQVSPNGKRGRYRTTDLEKDKANYDSKCKVNECYNGPDDSPHYAKTRCLS
jgi:hypothetical protein